MATVWPGWIAGTSIGLLMLAMYWITNKQLGISTTYGYACQFLPASDSYRSESFRSGNRWRLWFALGVPIGGLLGVLTTPGAEWHLTTSIGEGYSALLPSELPLQGLTLLGGGILMGLGARLAGGCTSGHVISGVAMLNPPSLLAGTLFFVGGVAMVNLLALLAG